MQQTLNLLPWPSGHSVLNKKLQWNLVTHGPEFDKPEFFLLGQAILGATPKAVLTLSLSACPQIQCLVDPGDFFLWDFLFFCHRMVRILKLEMLYAALLPVFLQIFPLAEKSSWFRIPFECNLLPFFKFLAIMISYASKSTQTFN